MSEMVPSDDARRPVISRRHLLQGVLAGGALLPGRASGAEPEPAILDRGDFSLDDIRVRFRCPAAGRPAKLLVLADTHLFRDDERGNPYREFSGRMAKAYNRTRNFRSGAETHPEACFEETLKVAAEEKADAIVLAGDLLSFPSEAAVEWVLERLEKCGIPWIYTAGNHDWHYEGMAGTSRELRDTWTGKSLRPLYQGGHPLMAAREVAGVKVVTLDNSTYEILPEQLDFFRKQAAAGGPMLLCVHIPLYAPGRPVGFGCGHPEWGAKSDDGFKIERRPRWPESGHNETTMAFHCEVFATPGLLGIFAGHIHQASLDVVKGIPQFVAGANATGAHLLVEVVRG